MTVPFLSKPIVFNNKDKIGGGSPRTPIFFTTDDTESTEARTTPKNEAFFGDPGSPAAPIVLPLRTLRALRRGKPPHPQKAIHRVAQRKKRVSQRKNYCFAKQKQSL